MEITNIADKNAGELSHGAQRTLEVAIALAADPLLVLLDEPTSGMSPEEAVRMVRLIRKLAKQRTMIVIEHNMNLVWSISTVITVLHQGQVIATGSPSEIEKNPEVRKAYLGGPPA
jgi:branched-chain amino acid transport system ATP-binding protein